MTCKQCIHESVCKIRHFPSIFGLTGDGCERFMPRKCTFPHGITIKPDGVNELDPCHYDEIERYRNVTVNVLRCQKCGHIEIEWERQEDTERIDNDR